MRTNEELADKCERMCTAIREAMALLDQREPRPEAAFSVLLCALNPELPSARRAAMTALRQSQRTEQKPLTDEQVDDLSRTMVKSYKSVEWLCRAIERAHGIGVAQQPPEGM